VVVESVNLGEARPMVIGARTISTGIDKQPAGRGYVGTLGLRDDTVADTAHHGGRDQAVYAYSREDYVWWESELRRPLAGGTFGENLTLSSFGTDPVRIGDRFYVGPVVLEVTSPRIPCSTFATHMAERNWVARFRDAERPGFYARVLLEGDVAVGDRVEREPAPAESVPLLELFRLFYDREADADRLRQALAAPVDERGRAHFEKRLARLARTPRARS
jgi:MOSC domain-containing protein YiiM